MKIQRIIEGAIVTKATISGGSCHVILPKEWLGKKIRCIPVDK
jgi:putative transposon-encoded protein